MQGLLFSYPMLRNELPQILYPKTTAIDYFSQFFNWAALSRDSSSLLHVAQAGTAPRGQEDPGASLTCPVLQLVWHWLAGFLFFFTHGPTVFSSLGSLHVSCICREQKVEAAAFLMDWPRNHMTSLPLCSIDQSKS